ncbi:MAG: DinB family protein [Gemmatimonadaceae bacterium]
MRIVRSALFLGAGLVALNATATTGSAQTPTGAPAPADAPTAGYRAEFLRELEYLESRFVSLAEQMPAEKYTWRPAEGVRSVGEVFLHVAGANYSLTRRIGTPPPSGFQGQGFDKSTTEKAKVVDHLKQSFAHMRTAALKAADADADKTMPWFNNSTITQRGFLVFVARHAGEHLGQSIAYARVNGIVPPWSEEGAQQPQRRP